MYLWEKIAFEVDTALRTCFPPTHREGTRPVPGENILEAPLTPSQKRQITGFMRVNHSGEVCAQALYRGQALMAGTGPLRESLEEAAQEEVDHLAWCEHRLNELGGHTSILDPLWYAGSWSLGILAGALGEGINLGFLAETERQVESHLQSHLERLPQEDRKTRAIIEQMQAEEACHAAMAESGGATPFPNAVRRCMHWTSGWMTTLSFYF
ncbi:MAG: 2-polyprenyl-3-methyl-6-methoxy-1,4-benzoquinone monooxygenase [Legionellaceae bacterium]|nr:2-polyprenyl-3-methyl-6-methoxy-1,4-benzoquinone monooxygenase [Legionellaceae bacterium]